MKEAAMRACQEYGIEAGPAPQYSVCSGPSCFYSELSALPKEADVNELLSSAAGSIGHCNTALSLSAGVSNPKVFLGRWFKRNAILFKYD